MKKLYEKSELTFAIVWIVLYCVLLSLGDSISIKIGIEKAITLPIAAALSLILFIYKKQNGMMKKYGLIKPTVPARKMLHYLPLIILLTANLWFGVKLNFSVVETVLYILTMLLVGFLEEVIFRGLLFNALAKDGVKSAVIISSITFGMGHIINLFNGSGAELVPNLLQVVYAIATGFMLVMIYLRSQSLIVCIVFHGVFNSLSAFSDEVALTLSDHMLSGIAIALISTAYAVYLYRSEKTEATEMLKN